MTVARIVVALLAAGLLVWAAAGAIPAGRASVDSALHPQGPTDDAFALAARYECVRGQLAERLPAGSVVAIGDRAATVDEIQWHQRLTDFAFPIATITDDPSRADFVIAVVPSMGPDACWGFGLTITPRAS